MKLFVTMPNAAAGKAVCERADAFAAAFERLGLAPRWLSAPIHDSAAARRVFVQDDPSEPGWHVCLAPLEQAASVYGTQLAVVFDWAWHALSGRAIGDDPMRDQLRLLSRANLVLAGSSHAQGLLNAAKGPGNVLMPTPIGAASPATAADSTIGLDDFPAPIWTTSLPVGAMRPERLSGFRAQRPGPLMIAALDPFAERRALKALLKAAGALESGQLLIALDLEPSRASFKLARGLLGLDDIAGEHGPRIGFIAEPLSDAGRAILLGAGDFFIRPCARQAGHDRLLLEAMAAQCVPITPGCTVLADLATEDTAILAQADLRALPREQSPLGVSGLREWGCSGGALAEAFTRAEAMSDGYRRERAQAAARHVANLAGDEALARVLQSAMGVSTGMSMGVGSAHRPGEAPTHAPPATPAPLAASLDEETRTTPPLPSRSAIAAA
ncbi:MAG: hypothetical protein MRY63_08435 [Neomegalonema sp.]|nr:hypothetical protein [Neomegalonema sp.]